ncbi:hypothetical protein SULPSESMR1_01154 [Pseudosulfitobacter pseudonitzschiae]|uniref:Translation initiation factor 3 n=2 Tax=Rhodobacterales TaxID=204455 RepID=A0A221JZ16_9RHOB|nr:hypothetical protein SULPSESMR1_01154 [Pseudosulfitobacter pseudonitzschiae]
MCEHRLEYCEGDFVMKNLLWIVVAAAVALGAYLLWSGRSIQEVATEAADAVNAPEALDSASDSVGAAVEATEGAVANAVDAAGEAAADTAEQASEAIAETASDAAAAASEAASDAADTASEAASDAATATEDAASEAATATEDAAPATEEVVTEDAAEPADTTADASNDTTTAVAEGTEGTAESVDVTAEASAETGSMADLLTAEGFDYDKVSAMIEGSDLGAVEKQLLTSGLEKARDNPEALELMLAKIREAMGM